MNAEYRVTSACTLRIALFGIGLDTYWPRFAGLKERFEGCLGCVAQKLARPGIEIINLGWRLEGQTNALNVGLTTNWFSVAGSGTTNQLFISFDPANGSVFFRLVYP